MKSVLNPSDRTCHNQQLVLDSPSLSCKKKNKKNNQNLNESSMFGGEINGKCKRHSKIFSPGEAATERGFGRAALCGCEPGFVRSLSEATSEPFALCNVSWRAQRTTLPLWIQKKPLLRCSVRMGGQ